MGLDCQRVDWAVVRERRQEENVGEGEGGESAAGVKEDTDQGDDRIKRGEDIRSLNSGKYMLTTTRISSCDLRGSQAV